MPEVKLSNPVNIATKIRQPRGYDHGDIWCNSEKSRSLLSRYQSVFGS